MATIEYMNLVMGDFEIEISYLESKIKHIGKIIDFEKRTTNKKEEIAGLELNRETLKAELSTYKEDLNNAKRYKNLMKHELSQLSKNISKMSDKDFEKSKNEIAEDIKRKVHSQVFNKK